MNPLILKAMPEMIGHNPAPQETFREFLTSPYRFQRPRHKTERPRRHPFDFIPDNQTYRRTGNELMIFNTLSTCLKKYG